MPPGGKIVAEHEPCAKPKDSHLHRHAQNLDESAYEPAAAVGVRLVGKDIRVCLLPPAGDAAQEPHGLDRIGIAHCGIDFAEGGDALAPGVGDLRLGDEFVDQRQGQQHDCADDGHPAEQRMQRKHRQQEQGRPGQIHKREHGRPGQEIAQRAKVAQALNGLHGRPAEAVKHACPQDVFAQKAVEPGANAIHDAAADHFQCAVAGEGGKCDQGQIDQRSRDCGWSAPGRRPAACRAVRSAAAH